MFRNLHAVPSNRRIRMLCACLALFLATASPARALDIVPTFDPTLNSVWNAKQVKDVINTVIKFYESKLTDNITVNITFAGMDSGLGQSSKPIYVIYYHNYLAALTQDAATANDTTALANLPVQYFEPVLGNSLMFISQANLKAVGIQTGNQSDGTIGLNTALMFTDKISIRADKYDMYAVVAHEIDEVLGLGSAVGFNGILPEDLFRYDINGLRSFTTDTAAAAYFSIDGTVRRARFNQFSSGDYGDWYSGVVAVTPQVQDAFATPGVIVDRKMNNELLALDVIGYNLGAQNTVNITGLTGARYYGPQVGHQIPGTKVPAAPSSKLVLPRGKGLFFPQE